MAEGWKTQYEVGDALSLTGLTVSLETYSDDVLSQTDAVTDFTLTIGEKTVQEGYVFVKEDVNDALTLSVHKDTYLQIYLYPSLIKRIPFLWKETKT